VPGVLYRPWMIYSHVNSLLANVSSHLNWGMIYYMFQFRKREFWTWQNSYYVFAIPNCYNLHLTSHEMNIWVFQLELKRWWLLTVPWWEDFRLGRNVLIAFSSSAQFFKSFGLKENFYAKRLLMELNGKTLAPQSVIYENVY